jgi:hypothetical protein
MARQAALVQNVLKLLFFEKITTNSTTKAWKKTVADLETIELLGCMFRLNMLLKNKEDGKIQSTSSTIPDISRF